LIGFPRSPHRKFRPPLKANKKKEKFLPLPTPKRGMADVPKAPSVTPAKRSLRIDGVDIQVGYTMRYLGPALDSRWGSF